MIEIDPEKPILVVDDEASDRLIISSILAHSELKNPVTELRGGEELVAYMEKAARGDAAQPALILVDINMPAISGFGAVARLRSMEAFQNEPLVAMLTSSDAAADQLEANRAGADIFLTKPSGVTKFIALINASFRNPGPEN